MRDSSDWNATASRPGMTSSHLNLESCWRDAEDESEFEMINTEGLWHHLKNVLKSIKVCSSSFLFFLNQRT